MARRWLGLQLTGTRLALDWRAVVADSKLGSNGTAMDWLSTAANWHDKRLAGGLCICLVNVMIWQKLAQWQTAGLMAMATG